jgi:hypothetical protein
MPDEMMNALRERYSSLTDDELKHLAITGGLTDQARELLQQELRRRGIEDVAEYKSYLDREDRKRLNKKQQTLERKEKWIRFYNRTGYSIAVCGILYGLFVLYIQKDERNGVGITVACVALIPFVWISGIIRRLIWRFLLRP